MTCMYISLGIVTILGLISFYVWLLDKQDEIDPVIAPPGAEAFEDGTYIRLVPSGEPLQAHSLDVHSLQKDPQEKREGFVQLPSEHPQHKILL